MTDEMITISLKAEKDVIDHLDQMVKADDTDRSKFIRSLIRKEWNWRELHGIVSFGELPHPPDAEPVPVVTLKAHSHGR